MKQNRLGSAKRRRGATGDGDGDSIVISPLLAEWAKSEDAGGATNLGASGGRGEDPDGVGRPDVVGGAGAGAGGDGQRRDEGRIYDLLDAIDSTLSTTNFDVPRLVADIASLTKLGSGPAGNGRNVNDRVLLPTLKSLLSSGTTTSSYRLAWVGSDDAICHVGTSLHKVPLARLQEVYLSLGGGGSVGLNKNKWELMEVIRILGPFPNVRNTLRGNVVGLTRGGSSKEREVVNMEISYTSMIDGTGKEILASSSGGRGNGRDGKKSNDGAKQVNLDVWFANDRAIVCSVPSSEGNDGRGGDPFGGDGSKLLFFVAENDLEGALEKLCAA
ncbi:hypothetical protein ACHAXA_011173 [Cyclostephanos tholiformis]|uniref:Uncharacterized protein n=1 Tax=Cyclostephanos tholiformis TaxID=382380 RepID=A0ABD3R7D4_9STRA